MCLHGNFCSKHINKITSSGLKIFKSCRAFFCILEEHALDHTWRFLLELVGLFERLLETEMVAELRNEAVSLVRIRVICEGRGHKQSGFKKKARKVFLFSTGVVAF